MFVKQAQKNSPADNLSSLGLAATPTTSSMASASHHYAISLSSHQDISSLTEQGEEAFVVFRYTAVIIAAAVVSYHHEVEDDQNLHIFSFQFSQTSDILLINLHAILIKQQPHPRRVPKVCRLWPTIE